LFGGGLENRRYRAADCASFARTQQEQRQGHRCGMRHHARSRLQLRLPPFSALPLNPYGPDFGPSFLVQSARKIDDRAPGVASPLPIVPRTLCVGGEKSEIDVSELFGSHTLDEVNLIACSLKLADRFVIVEQANVDGGEVALADHFGHFFPFQRRRAYDSGAKKLAAR
jgi:hypothetical protein